MTIHYEAEEFIVQDDTQWVVYNDTINTIIQDVTLRSASLGPLGFFMTAPTSATTTTILTTSTMPPATTLRTLELPELPDLSSLPMLPMLPMLDQLVITALGSLPLWFLIGGVWALITSFSVSQLRSELSSLAFLFMPQSNSLAITKTAVDKGIQELDAALAAVFLGIQKTDRGDSHGYAQSPYKPGSLLADLVSGFLDGLLRLTMLGLSLVTGPLQFVRHLLGLLIVKLCPDCDVLSDYKNWLDNISTGDTRASSYIMDKASGVYAGSFGYSGAEFQNNNVNFHNFESAGSFSYSGGTGLQNNINFPNFENQFEGV